jgi:riboflavin synthase
MFTGLIEETGTVGALNEKAPGSFILLVLATKIGPELRVGDSVAVNGCCLTVTEATPDKIRFDLLAETLRRTNLGSLPENALVNLERALPANGRFGGHIVQGHIDCTAPARAFEKVEADHRLEVELPPEFAQYMVPKGSIAINGVSLTVAEVSGETFTVWIIPHTFAATNLHAIRTGDSLNLEFDILAKYVERMVRK